MLHELGVVLRSTERLWAGTTQTVKCLSAKWIYGRIQLNGHTAKWILSRMVSGPNG